MFDTIVAIASGNINQAISIIRISGPEALKIISRIFTGKIGENKTISFGYIVDENNDKIDEVLVSIFRGKNNFVGEDTIEINAHGGIIITNIILQLVVINGARLASPGEFSRRAFLNGKIDLIKAEAINDLIHSKTKIQTQIAIQKFNNKSSELISDLIKIIEKIIGICEVNIDYPEYDDIEQMDQLKIIKIIKEIKNKIESIIKISEENQIFMEPQSVVIVGQPNVGKSELMNLILNEEKSIVTDIAGTTRDVVEGEIIFNNIILKFKDTAGIRNTNDVIEKIGIEKSFQQIENSSIILHVMDVNKTIDEIDMQIEEKSKGKLYFKIYNKSDLLPKNKLKNWEKKIIISAKNKDITKLEQEFNKHFNNILLDHSFSFNSRQIILLKKGQKLLSEALKAIDDGMGFDVVIVDIVETWENIKSIVGDINKEDLLDSIFSNFCLGK
ncbi:MAG: tRNA uridine-5-carboxymethylaminomethyl(34) synthesis GTPase MnmE [Mycoplasmataceae bacterium]|nr:tRNA uridine-5-carboxymethylaminomethyl(34) synthesis GTPase MnmE [Mycoplasmataceae bacterium]